MNFVEIAVQVAKENGHNDVYLSHLALPLLLSLEVKTEVHKQISYKTLSEFMEDILTLLKQKQTGNQALTLSTDINSFLSTMSVLGISNNIEDTFKDKIFLIFTSLTTMPKDEYKVWENHGLGIDFFSQILFGYGLSSYNNFSVMNKNSNYKNKNEIKDDSIFKDLNTQFNSLSTDSKKQNKKVLYTKNIDGVIEKKKIKIDYLDNEKLNHEIRLSLSRINSIGHVILGNVGNGKTSALENFAKKIMENNFKELIGFNCYFLDMVEVLEGSIRGLPTSVDDKLNLVLQELDNYEQSLLFVDNIHVIENTNMLKSLLSKHKTKIIATADKSIFVNKFMKDLFFVNAMGTSNISEVSKDFTIKVSYNFVENLINKTGIKLESDDILNLAYTLTETYVENLNQPSKTVNLLDTCYSYAQINNIKIIDESVVKTSLSKLHNKSITSINKSQKEKLKKLDEQLKKQIFGQEHAIEKLMDALLISTMGLRDNRKTVCSLVFQGPTATGKTEICRILAKELDIPLIRYDMSEFMEKHTVHKLIGSPPGYIGYNDGGAGGGKLINDIRANPHCVLLLDEMEKAHPSVMNLFLQVMDNGMMSSSSGEEANFRNVILVMTTNMGAKEAEKNSIGFGNNDNSHKFEDSVKEMLLPELRSRIDSIIVFNKLGKSQISLVIDKFFNQIKTQLYKNHQIELEMTDNAKEYFIKKTMENNLGARVSYKLLEQNISNKISRDLVYNDKEYKKYKVDFENNSIMVLGE